MKNSIVTVLVVLFLLGTNSYVFSSNGPAPNSGDGISDRSGMDTQNGPNSDTGNSDGPAPNSGDGDSDGSGW